MYTCRRHWEWQEDRRIDLQPGLYRYNTAFVVRLDVKAAFNMAKPSVVSKIFSLVGVHGHFDSRFTRRNATCPWLREF